MTIFINTRARVLVKRLFLMPVANLESPFETVHSGHTLFFDIPPPYRDSPQRSLSLLTEKGPREIRPLPQPPAHSPGSPNSVAARPAPRRRASGGCFVDLEARPRKKTQRFYVCNPSDSPISPAQPSFPSPNPHSGQSFLPIHVTPATPLPPPTPGLVQSHTNLTPPMPAPDPPSAETMPHIRTVKMHRRFGGSVSSIPASALAELRSLGEEKCLSRAMTLPVRCRGDDSDNSSNEDDDGDANEDYSWEMTRSVRLNRRISPK
ncbi:hypothetical protein FB451DRAFT_140404 [Mycena latifolia]|nr:hypothetical protein FB451DRAFT_140404 [Mycena latifolia]